MRAISAVLRMTALNPRLASGLLLLLAFAALTAPALAPASGYGYDSDVDNPATVDSAQRILSQTGGVFIGPDLLRKYFNVSPRLPYRLPFTERDLWDCGRCVLFPTIARIGYRKAKTSIMKLQRSSEARQLFIRTHSPITPWFKDESWAKQPLRTGWHLVHLELQGKGEPPRFQGFYQGQERPPAPNVAFWMLLLLPDQVFAGEAFLTNATTHGGKSLVTVGRPKPGAIRIHHTPRELGSAGVGRIAEIIPKR